jgi:hypothetical protein
MVFHKERKMVVSVELVRLVGLNLAEHMGLLWGRMACC